MSDQFLTDAAGRDFVKSSSAVTWLLRSTTASLIRLSSVTAANNQETTISKIAIRRTQFGNLGPVLVGKDVVKNIAAGAWAHLYSGRSIAVQHSPATLDAFSVHPGVVKQQIR